ncbi:hypothetical protein R3P38DRAFT_818276 [Favolaschia claudopus]|uniref:F-box domain-containing protein n=1 Tax=Favolaschia claudopus TaxID=2862362 RepID=A0AAW0BYT2_9AGAR
MAFSFPLQVKCGLLDLPAELLLIIICFLRQTYGYHRGDDENYTIYTRHVAALSVVCRHLRQLCLPVLFSHIKIKRMDQFHLLASKCEMEPEFAFRIRKLDLFCLYPSPNHQTAYSDILTTLLPRLRSLTWLNFHVKIIDIALLSLFNSHPKLATVAISDINLLDLGRLSKSTSLSLSKLRVPYALSTTSFGFHPTYRSLARRGLRIARLKVRDTCCIKAGPGTLTVSGLEELEIPLNRDRQPTFPMAMAWLPTFASRHDNLSLVTFNLFQWECGPDVPFASQFLAALDRESPKPAIRLLSPFQFPEPSALRIWKTGPSFM